MHDFLVIHHFLGLYNIGIENSFGNKLRNECTSCIMSDKTLLLG